MRKQALGFTPDEQRFLTNLLIAGTALGGAGGLAASYGNYLKNLHTEAEKPEDDEAALDITLPQVKQAKEMGDLTWGLAPVALTLPAVLSYLASRKAYQKLRANELKTRLKDSEEAYTESLLEEAEQKRHTKYATERQSVGIRELIPLLTLGAIPIGMIGSAYLTNRALEKHFPAVKDPGRDYPKRMRIRRAGPTPNQPEPTFDEAEDPEDDETWAKQASESDRLESLCRVVLGFPGIEKRSTVVRLVRQLGYDPQGVAEAMMDGLDGYEDFRKSATAPMWETSLERSMMIHQACKSAAAPQLEIELAAEVYEAVPQLVKVATHIEKRHQEWLLKEAALRGMASRYRDAWIAPGAIEFLRKEAAARQLEVPDLGESDTIRSVTPEDDDPDSPESRGVIAAKPPADEVDSVMAQLTGNPT